MLTAGQLHRIGTAPVGVLGFVTSRGQAQAVPITPYVVAGRVVITSTLALIDKGAAIRRDPRVTVTAGGLSIVGTASVHVDLSPAYFDRHLRSQELAKYPPSRALLGLPLHRRLLGWYVGRVVIRIDPDEVHEQPLGDRTTLTVLDHHGGLLTRSVPAPSDLRAEQIHVGDHPPDGAGVLLVHEEDPVLRDLRQLTVHGQVAGGVLEVTRRRGTLDPTRRSTLDDVRQLRSLARRARANRERLRSWPAIGADGDE